MLQVRLGELLVRADVIGPEDLREALAEQTRSGRRLGPILDGLGVVDEETLASELAGLSHLSRLALSTAEIDPVAAKWADKTWALRHRVATLSVDETAREIVVAISDPTHVGALDELAFKCGLRVRAVIGTDREVEQLIHRQYAALAQRPKTATRDPSGSVPAVRAAEPPKPRTDPLGAPLRAALRPSSAPVDAEAWRPLRTEDFVVMRSMNEMRDELHGTKSVPPQSNGMTLPPIQDAVPLPADALMPLADDERLYERLADLISANQAASLELQAVFELCVAKGIIARHEYLERLNRTSNTALV